MGNITNKSFDAYCKKETIDLKTTDWNKLKAKYTELWNSAIWMAKYRYQETGLNDFFAKYSQNSDSEIVKEKCRLLDLYYSTNLRMTHGALDQVTKTIVENFDKEINSDNIVTLVNTIATVKDEKSDEEKDLTSFASKYCSRYASDRFPIYDKYVRQMLTILHKHTQFSQTLRERKDICQYENFVQVMREFVACKKFWHGETIDFKTADRMLWTWAKDILHFENGENV